MSSKKISQSNLLTMTKLETKNCGHCWQVVVVQTSIVLKQFKMGPQNGGRCRQVVVIWRWPLTQAWLYSVHRGNKVLHLSFIAVKLFLNLIFPFLDIWSELLLQNGLFNSHNNRWNVLDHEIFVWKKHIFFKSWQKCSRID